MNLLSFDTSSDALSLAVTQKGVLVKEVHQVSPARHSSALIPAIERALIETKMTIHDIDVIAVGLGPGSFTGIRVAVMTAKMLAFALNKKIVGVSSLEAIARAALSASTPKVAVLLDARKSKVYAAGYELKKGRVVCVAAPALRPQTEIRTYQKKGFEVITQAEPSARYVAMAAQDLIVKNRFTKAEKLEPQYLHPKDCNVTIKKGTR